MSLRPLCPELSNSSALVHKAIIFDRLRPYIRNTIKPLKRPTINITPAERLGRILVGLIGLIGGLVLLASAAGALVVILEVLLVVAGLDLIVTGALGFCPLYHKFGYTPSSLRSPE